MRNVLVFVGLFLYLFTTTEFKQFLKIPVFVDHYFEHKDDNASMGLLEFVSMHYLEGFVIDEDVARDMQLPFRSCDHTGSSSVVALEPSLFWMDCSSPFQSYNEQFRCLTSFDIPSSQYIASIWQPPRA